MSIVYSVKFRPGRYKTVLNPVNPNCYNIGREDDGYTVGFAFTPNDAAHICMALNLADAYISGDTAGQSELLRALQKLRH